MSPNTIKTSDTKLREERIKKSQHQLHYVSLLIFHSSHLLEIALALLLTAALVISAVQLIPSLLHMAMADELIHSFTEFLEEVFTLTVGVEALKMLCKHTPGSALEVLLFALARSIVINHNDGKYALIGVICIVLLFAARKFLYVHDFDTRPDDDSIFAEVEGDEPLFGHKPAYIKPHQHQIHSDEDGETANFIKTLQNDPKNFLSKEKQSAPEEDFAFAPLGNQLD